MQANSTATLNIEVMLVSYDNPDSEECIGGHCERFAITGGDCDNIFEFCLRPRGGGSCLQTITSNEISEDTITFTPSQLNELELSNPLQFSSISTSVSDH